MNCNGRSRNFTKDMCKKEVRVRRIRLVINVGEDWLVGCVLSQAQKRKDCLNEAMAKRRF